MAAGDARDGGYDHGVMTNRSPLRNARAVQPAWTTRRLPVLVLLLLAVALTHGVYADSPAGHAAAHTTAAPHGPAPVTEAPAPEALPDPDTAPAPAPEGHGHGHPPVHHGEHCASAHLPPGPGTAAPDAVTDVSPPAAPCPAASGRAPAPAAAGHGTSVVRQV